MLRVVFVQLMYSNFPKTGVTNCVPSDPRTSGTSSIGVEWSGASNVTAAGSTKRGYGLPGRPPKFYKVYDDLEGFA